MNPLYGMFNQQYIQQQAQQQHHFQQVKQVQDTARALKWVKVDWTSVAPSPSDTIRNSEERSIEVSPSRTEYRYVGYATTDGRHECWCETYLRSKFGSAVLRCSDWSTTRHGANGSAWSCGQCNGNHTGVDHYGNDGRAWWAEFTLPDGRDFYWEENRTIPAEYRTEYKYEKWVPN